MGARNACALNIDTHLTEWENTSTRIGASSSAVVVDVTMQPTSLSNRYPSLFQFARAESVHLVLTVHIHTYIRAPVRSYRYVGSTNDTAKIHLRIHLRRIDTRWFQSLFVRLSLIANIDRIYATSLFPSIVIWSIVDVAIRLRIFTRFPILSWTQI